MKEFLDYCKSEDHWEDSKADLSEAPISHAECRLSGNFYWECVLPYIDQPEGVKETFFQSFAKCETRDQARMSVVEHNRQTAHDALDAIAHYAHDRDQWTSFPVVAASAIRALDLIVDFMKEPEPKVFRQMADIMDEAPPADGEPKGGKGDHHDADGNVWREFCKYYVENWELPCKKELRELAGLEQRQFTRALGKLGLQGLPKG